MGKQVGLGGRALKGAYVLEAERMGLGGWLTQGTGSRLQTFQ